MARDGSAFKEKPVKAQQLGSPRSAGTQSAEGDIAIAIALASLMNAGRPVGVRSVHVPGESEQVKSVLGEVMFKPRTKTWAQLLRWLREQWAGLMVGSVVNASGLPESVVRKLENGVTVDAVEARLDGPAAIPSRICLRRILTVYFQARPFRIVDELGDFGGPFVAAIGGAR